MSDSDLRSRYELLWRMFHDPLTLEYRRIWVARKLLIAYEVCTAKDFQDLPIEDLYALVRQLEAEGQVADD